MDEGAQQSEAGGDVRRRVVKKKKEQFEQPPMVTHWKPTGQKIYQVDMKPTVIRRPTPSPSRLAWALPLDVGDLVPPVKDTSLGVGNLVLPVKNTSLGEVASPDLKGAFLGVFAPPEVKNTSLGVGNLVSPVKSTSLGVGNLVPPALHPELAHATSRGDESARISRQLMWRAPPPSPDSSEMCTSPPMEWASPSPCSPCLRGRCCRREGRLPCRPDCRCALLRAWAAAPRKCDPQVWRDARKLQGLPAVDHSGANFAWMGWSYVSDFATTQSGYG